MALPYWIDDNLNIWTKTSIAANSSTVLYVRKQDGYSPDGDAVFELFDDFEGDSLDTGKWDISGTPAYTVSDGKLYLSSFSSSGQYLDISSKNAFGAPFVVEASVQYPKHTDGNGGLALFRDGGFTSFIVYGSAGGTGDGFGLFGDVSYKWGQFYDFSFKKRRFVVDETTVVAYTELFSNTYSFSSSGYNKVGFRGEYLAPNLYVDHIFVRKYADQEPTVLVEQIDDTTWKITITNNNDYDLVDYQVCIPIALPVYPGFYSDSWLITDTLSNATLSFEVSELNPPHIPTTINITNVTGDVSKFIINWGDGTTEEINAETTTANHTYDWEDNFKITVSSLVDSEANILATNSTTVKVAYPLDEIPYKYLVKVANPTSQNFTNYPLEISLTDLNFDFLLAKPLGTDIYFRDSKCNIYKHFIQNYSISDQKATVVVQIPQLLPNSYAEFYLCVDRDDKDRAQYTFDTSGTDISILYTIISELSILPDEPNNITTYQMISSTTSSYQNITIVCIDEASYLQKETTGSVRFVSSDGKETFYQLDNFKKGILKVPSSNNTGLIILLTDDGVMRKIPYSTDALNSVFLPPQSAPVLLKGSDGTGWTVYNDRGAYISYVSDDSVVYLTPGQMYDFYVGDEAVKKGYMILGSGDVVYYRKDTPEVMGKIITEQIIMENNNSVKLIISAKQNATIQFSDGANDTLINGNTYTYIKPDGTEYWIYGTDGTEYKHGILSVENWGKLKEFGENYPNLAKWIGYMLIITVLLAGSYITIYIALPASVITALILIRVGWIELDLLTTSLITLIALGSFIYFFVKRNW